MYFMKRLFLYFIIILFIISLYKDLTDGYSSFNNSKLDPIQQTYSKEHKIKSSIVAVRVQPGDTLLSITEQINQPLPELDMKQIMFDFKAINPNIDPFDLEIDSIYYFHKY